MFKIKICGFTNGADAELAVQAGADAIGLNFYPDSRRFVTVDAAQRILERIPQSVARVGIFVNAPVDHVAQTFDLLKLDFVQLHGDEPSDRLVDLAPRPVIKAFRYQARNQDRLLGFVEEAERLGASPAAVLIDSCHANAYGGTGRVGDWSAIAGLMAHLGGCQVVLSGGLRPANVAEAIGTVRPSAVDVASGVESAPGIKDAALVRRFVDEARAALASVGG